MRRRYLNQYFLTALALAGCHALVANSQTTMFLPEAAQPAPMSATTGKDGVKKAPPRQTSVPETRKPRSATPQTPGAAPGVANVIPPASSIRAAPASTAINAPGSAPPSDAVIAQNATASAGPAASVAAANSAASTKRGASADSAAMVNGSATASGGASTESESTLSTRRPLNIKARLDDGRSVGFRQSGGDQPAGDQQFRSPERVQTENDKLSRNKGTGNKDPK